MWGGAESCVGTLLSHPAPSIQVVPQCWTLQCAACSAYTYDVATHVLPKDMVDTLQITYVGSSGYADEYTILDDSHGSARGDEHNRAVGCNS